MNTCHARQFYSSENRSTLLYGTPFQYFTWPELNAATWWAPEFPSTGLPVGRTVWSNHTPSKQTYTRSSTMVWRNSPHQLRENTRLTDLKTWTQAPGSSMTTSQMTQAWRILPPRPVDEDDNEELLQSYDERQGAGDHLERSIKASSGFAGVQVRRNPRNFIAYCTVNGTRKHIGTYKTAHEAAQGRYDFMQGNNADEASLERSDKSNSGDPLIPIPRDDHGPNPLFSPDSNQPSRICRCVPETTRDI
jgi:hypothetical protein